MNNTRVTSFLPPPNFLPSGSIIQACMSCWTITNCNLLYDTRNLIHKCQNRFQLQDIKRNTRAELF